MKPPAFEYHRPDTADDAVAMLAQLGDGAKVLAGGQSLVPMLALRLTMFEHLIDITRIAELQGIEREAATLQIGAGTTDVDIETSSEVAATVPLLARATPLIGHFQIRNRGTIGGSIVHADPAAEYPAVALALDATLEVLGTAGARSVSSPDFFTGLWDTAIDDDELLTAISFPVWSGRCGFAVEEVARRHGDFAIAGTALALEVDSGDTVVRCGIGLFGLAPTPVRASAVEAEIVGRHVDEIDAEELGQLAISDLDDVPSDLHSPAAYRRRVGAVTVTRALRSAMSEACG